VTLEGAIITCHLKLMAWHPDSLIARKRGLDETEDASRLARQVLDARWETGKSDPKQSQAGDVKAEVCVTRTGQKYHCDGCRHLSKSKILLSPEAARKRYESCSVCNPPR
jgi:hypothetical protein